MRSRFTLRFSLFLSLLFLFLYKPIIFGVRKNSFFDGWENSWQDFLFRAHSASLRPGDPRIIIAAIDDETLHQYAYPLPRIVYAQLLSKMKSYGVKTVAFDVIFYDPRSHDADLIAATRKFKKTIHSYTFEISNTKKGISFQTRSPIPGLAEAAEALGYVSIGDLVDYDGHLRKFRLFNRRVIDPKTQQMGAALEAPAYESFTGTPRQDLIREYANPSPEIFFINFRPPLYPFEGDIYPHRYISIAKLVSGDLTPDQKRALKGSIVYIGSTALAAFDHYPSPFMDMSPGVEFHANIVDNLLHHDWRRPFLPLYTIVVILLMIWFPLFFRNFSPPVSTSLSFLLITFWCLFANWEFLNGTRVEFMAPAFALVVSFMSQTIYQAFNEGREKRFIKNLFSQFVSPEVVNDLAKHPDKIKLGGERRDMTILFLDIANFTAISEKMTPENLISFLNRYLAGLTQVIHEHGGVVDKYIGDCIMAFWNAPIEVADHRKRACLAAIGAQEMMQKLNLTLDSSIPEAPSIRIGINSGNVTVGLTGSEKKLQYTVIGDEVNLASRLEGANKFFGSKIMASDSAYLAARGAVEGRELGFVRVVGKNTPVKIYEILTRKGELPEIWKQALPIYKNALEEIRAHRYVLASALFERFLTMIPHDSVAEFYVTVCKTHAADSQTNPWDGVVNLTVK